MLQGQGIKRDYLSLGNGHADMTFGNPFAENDINPFLSLMGEKEQLDMVVDVNTFYQK